jgi:uncharacterized integral membrane protein (TIGR00697 family)
MRNFKNCFFFIFLSLFYFLPSFSQNKSNVSDEKKKIIFSFVFFAARKGVDWLFGSIIANLFLVGIFGAKLLIIFGYATNAGNVFYACVFLATHFLLELYGSKVAKKTIFYGLIFTVFFLIMSQFTFQFSGIKTSESVNNAIYTLFVFSPRIFFASVMAYIFAQNINIFLFEWLKTQTKGKTLWLRSNAANILGQLVDSLIFFSIAVSF